MILIILLMLELVSMDRFDWLNDLPAIVTKEENFLGKQEIWLDPFLLIQRSILSFRRVEW